MKRDVTDRNPKSGAQLLDVVHAFRARSALVGVMTLTATLGCGPSVEGDSDDSVGSDSQALEVEYDPSLEVYWDGPNLIATISGAVGTPAVASHCPASYVAFTLMSPSGRYRGAGVGEFGPSPWADYDGRAFASSPSVTGLPGCPTLRFLIVGRLSGTGANSRILWSEGESTQSGGMFSTPTKKVLTDFEQVSAQEFTGTDGYPAVTSTPNGQAYLVYRSGNTIYGHYKAAGASTWSSPRAQAPALPWPWVPVGTPAIEFGFVGATTVFVRARNTISGTHRFFRIFMLGGAFYEPFGSLQWGSLPFPGGSPPAPPIESDPALEWNSTLLTHTVYYRSGSSYYQASIYYDTWEEKPKQVLNAPPAVTPAYSSAPSVNGNVEIEIGRTHWALGRAGTNLYFSVVMEDDGDLVP